MQTVLQGREVASPNAFIGRISGEQWSISPGNYRLYSAVSYSMHGNCYNLLLQLDAESVSSRGGAGE
ncbi:hypothetical protein D3C86_2096600 [compost metagenome]